MNATGNFHVYRSSAGSGKTFTLAKFYLSLILKQKSTYYFKHILAITFTVKAAAEMKERIIDYISGFADPTASTDEHRLMLSLISKEINSDETIIITRSKAILNAMLHDYSNLSIYTIDKFVHRLVRSFASELGLNPDFEVEIDSKQLIDRVVSAVMDKVGVDAEISKLILEYSKYQIQSDKYWDVTSSLETLAFELNSEDFFIQSGYTEKLNPALIFKVQNDLRDRIEHTKSMAQEIGHRINHLLERFNIKPKDLYQGSRGVLGYFNAAIACDFSKLVTPNNYVLQTIESHKWQSGSKNPSVIELQDELEGGLASLLEQIDEFKDALLFQNILPHLFKLGLISELRMLFAEIKSDENQQLLSDFYKLLSDRFNKDQTPFIYERLGAKYHHILIDEFQDTSRLQWQNLLPLFENTIAEGNRSLLVGDAKQSIYRFRGSEPDQFVNQPVNNRPTDVLLQSEFNKSVLDSNYRSLPSIVRFNNRFFKELSQQFLQPNEQPFYDDVEQKPIKKAGGIVTIKAIDLEENCTIEESLFPNIEKSIASRIKAGVQPSNICLLFQRNSDASFFAGKLLEAGYSVTSDESLLLSNNLKIQLLIATIEAYTNSLDQFFQQRFLARIYQNNLLIGDYHEIATWLKTDKASFAQLCNRLQLKLNQSLFNQDSFGIMLGLIQLFNLNSRDVFIKKILDYALLYDETSTYLKHSFLDQWAKDAEKLSIEVSANVNALQVMTIHKSKGLEFPFVYVYLPKFQAKSTTKTFAWINQTQIENLETAMVPCSSLKNTRYESLYTEEKAKTNVDLINALYVAFTRAKEGLEVFTLNSNGKLGATPLSFIQDWNEWDAEKMELHYSY